jgi:hypothetical protein
VIHGFFSMGDLVPEGKAAIDEAAEALRAALGSRVQRNSSIGPEQATNLRICIDMGSKPA